MVIPHDFLSPAILTSCFFSLISNETPKQVLEQRQFQFVDTLKLRDGQYLPAKTMYTFLIIWFTETEVFKHHNIWDMQRHYIESIAIDFLECCTMLLRTEYPSVQIMFVFHFISHICYIGIQTHYCFCSVLFQIYVYIYMYIHRIMIHIFIWIIYSIKTSWWMRAQRGFQACEPQCVVCF